MDLQQAVFNHLVLPPKIPGGQDPNIDQVAADITQRLEQAIDTFIAFDIPQLSRVLHDLHSTIHVGGQLNKGGRLDQPTLLLHLSRLQPNRTVILHIVEQNAGLFIRRENYDGEDNVIFEAFETSAPSEKVLAATQALRWDFPGRAAKLPIHKFMKPSFQAALATFLEKASTEAIHSLQATTRKAGVLLSEVRDTTDPALISHMLIPMLEALGDHYKAPTLRKRIRDDVNYRVGVTPWRRLPFWLVLRVTAQRQLCLAFGNEQGQIVYKFLMCLLLAQLMKDSVGSLIPELIVTLRAKLCRRMAKLEMGREHATSSVCKELYKQLFEHIGSSVAITVKEGTAQIEAAWESFKRKTIRRVPLLPLRAPVSSRILTLPNSGDYLRGLLASQSVQQHRNISLELPKPLDASIEKTRELTDHIFELASIEGTIFASADADLNPNGLQTYASRCIKLAGQIDDMFSKVGKTYESDPVQTSIMILAIFTLWVRLDRCAVKACPLLADYHPVFSSKLLDVLQLPTLSQMRRLQQIQHYLSQRKASSQYGTIFGALDKDCLAVRYVAQSHKIPSLGEEVQAESDEVREDKIEEWKRLCKEYDEHTLEISDGICCCTWKDGERVVKGCEKCWHWRTRNRMKIEAHEAFLPERDPARAVVLFELDLPPFLSKYRNVTWRILRDLAHPSRPIESATVRIKLQDCEPLSPYMSATTSGISLASALKCFAQTHYKFSTGKMPLSQVLLPLAADFRLYDNASGQWVEDFREYLTFEHLCGVHVPLGLQAGIMLAKDHPPAVVDGPSSYETQANQPLCPSDMSVHEFSAYQRLLAGKVRRWPSILVEMGSSNLNFSSEDTTQLLYQLAIQAGPQLPDEVLRATHVVFREPDFVERLVDLVEQRLRSISTNWREKSCMELLISLSMRLFELSGGPVKLRAAALLKTARESLLGWIARLRTEVQTASNAVAAQQIATYGISAAIFCRRTFALTVDLDGVMSFEDLANWTEASLALQENLLVEIDRLPKMLKRVLIRDMKMALHLQPILKQAVKMHPGGIGIGILRSWSDSLDSVNKSFSKWEFLVQPNDRWMVSRYQAQGKSSFVQILHLNITEGHLLVNGKPRDKLPIEIRNSPTVKGLFGNQYLLTYPSSFPGMTHRLVNCVAENQEIHFGLRGNQVVIRAYMSKERRLLEFVPREKFTGNDTFDLPAELVHNCTHWLDLDNGLLEVRRATSTWIKKPSDWTVDVKSRSAWRRNVTLVDPGSELCQKINEVFRCFESPERLTVYQPSASIGRLSVELRHMDLAFEVNHDRMLECRQLKAVIDENQDAGTWYGLESKIVMRSTASQGRSIIVPLGNVQHQRQGMHLRVRMDGANDYGRYTIDEVLGRVSCAIEPRLLYTKALCHAFTSFCLPDSLTGRTGTEEAFITLKSGAAQPWIPIHQGANWILDVLKSLSPKREYYPPDVTRIQRVTWTDTLTTTIQHDSFESLVRVLMKRSNDLNKFGAVPTPEFEIGEQAHLRRRAESQRKTYERPTQEMVCQTYPDTVYIPRDRISTVQAGNVFKIARILATRCSALYMDTTLTFALESYQVIAGFHEEEFSDSANKPLTSQIEDSINEQWGDLVNFCRNEKNQATKLFRLSLLSFAPNCDMSVIRALAAISSLQSLRSLPPPEVSSFDNFQSRGRPPHELLEKLISSACIVFRPLLKRGKPTTLDSAGRTAETYSELCEEQGKQLASRISKQWPNPTGSLSTGGLELNLIDIPLAFEKIRPEWERRRANLELEYYINNVQAELDQLQTPRDTVWLPKWKDEGPWFLSRVEGQIIPSIPLDLVVKLGPALKPISQGLSFYNKHTAATSVPLLQPRKQLPSEFTELEHLLEIFANSTNELRQQYGNDLLRSLAALKNTDRTSQTHDESTDLNLGTLDLLILNTRETLTHCLEDILTALAANDRRSTWLQQGLLWPCMTRISVLELLRSASSHRFGRGMKEALVMYGLVITSLQRLLRIRDAILHMDNRVIGEELRNHGHESWSPLLRPDWLLLEIDSNLLIRAEQIEVACAIITPPSGQNSVLQMNMGKGKTSCIVPMAVAAIADGRNLSRLIVPKALLMQTAQMMQTRLGGLVGRDILHIPFSRKTQTTPAMLGLYTKLHNHAHTAKGVILTSHEHILSFKLGGWQHLADGKLEAAGTMIKLQKRLDTNCRDVLDECDFTLSVKTQLNYPGGSEVAVDGHPFRWHIAQGLLDLVLEHIRVLRREYPGQVDVLMRPNRLASFPMVHMLSSKVEDALHDRILHDICTGKTTFLRPAESTVTRSQQRTVRRALSDKEFDQPLFADAVRVFVNQQASAKMLLVIRGVLLNRILVLCLNKRWNVQYGLHPARHPVAVPFEAKSTPSEQSEFGHPDVAILFTCLSFYYSGLNLSQFKQGLQQVLQSDDPAAQYEWWTSNCSELPDALRHWNVINIDDVGQVQQLWNHLCLDRTVINHYLNHFVFPIHAKQFEVKLQASSWDIPIFHSRKQSGPRTTGFSGTNDNRSMLPLTIRQDDLPSLQQTSAEVLSYLFQTRNRSYHVTTDTNGKRFTEKGLLEMLHKKGIRTLIDAGAYILELDNAMLARAWLEIDSSAKAAIYFGTDNRAWVHYRGETKANVPLIATPFVDNLSDCVVYLDEAHTRGVDLKLPTDAHGALTLALKQTKDYTMQAAMRLRQLSTTQSITFFAPPEVDQSIRDFCSPARNEKLNSAHVINWLLEQSCRTNEDLRSLYVAQGIDFCRRVDAEWGVQNPITNSSDRNRLLKVLRQPERQTLDQLYGGAVSSSLMGSLSRLSDPQLQKFADKLTQPGSNGNDVPISALEEVEQEREVQVQIEQIREIQKPIRYDALSFHGLHPDISYFIQTGVLDRGLSYQRNPGYDHAFAWIAQTALGKRFGVRATNSRMFVSKEFGRTIKTTGKNEHVIDNFIRPVEWILWSSYTETALVIIPEEAERIIPMLRAAAGRSPVHLIAYAAPVTRAMLSFNSLRYYCLPSLPTSCSFPEWFRFELGILAGRLYINLEEWDSLARYLRSPSRLVSKATFDDKSHDKVSEQEVQTLSMLDGADDIHPALSFTDRPLEFLVEWLVLRRKTQDILHTPVGYICSGRMLGEDHPFRETLL